jgi:hypothetical protein
MSTPMSNVFTVKIYLATSVRYSPTLGVEFLTDSLWQFIGNDTTTFAITTQLIRNQWNVTYPKLAACPLQYQCRVNRGIGGTPNYFILMTIGDETSWRTLTRMVRRRTPDTIELVVTPVTTIPKEDDDDDDDFVPREGMLPLFCNDILSWNLISFNLLILLQRF